MCFDGNGICQQYYSTLFLFAIYFSCVLNKGKQTLLLLNHGLKSEILAPECYEIYHLFGFGSQATLLIAVVS